MTRIIQLLDNRKHPDSSMFGFGLGNQSFTGFIQASTLATSEILPNYTTGWEM